MVERGHSTFAAAHRSTSASASANGLNFARLNANSLLFAGLLIAMILLIAGLSYLPALTLGPIAEPLIPLSR